MSSMNRGPTAGGGDSGDDCCEIERLSQLMDGEWGDIDLSQSVIGLCGDEVLRLKWARFHMARDAMQQEPVSAGNALSARICAAIAVEDTYSNVTAIAGLNVTASVDGKVPSLPMAASGAGVSAAGDVADKRMEATATSGKTTRTGFGAGAPRTFVAGFGLAASVALVTVVGMNALQGRGDATDSTTSVPVQNLASAAGASRAALELQPGSPLESPIGSPVGSPVGSGIADVPVSVETVGVRQVRDVPVPEVQFVANTRAYWIAPESSLRRIGSEERLNMMLSDHIENSPTAERHGMLPYSRLVGYGEGAVGRR